MKKNSKIIILIIVVLIIISICYEFNIRLKINGLVKAGVDIVRKEHGVLLFGVNGLYSLNLDKEQWEPCVPRGLEDIKFQVKMIDRNIIIYENLSDYSINLYYFDAPHKSLKIDVREFGTPCSLSHDGSMISYFAYLPSGEEEALYIVNLKNFDSKVFPNIEYSDSLSWAFDGNSLFFSNGNNIKEMNVSDGHTEIIAHGFWVKVLPNNVLGYWRGEDEYYVCYKMNLSNKVEKEICRTKHCILGTNWDPTGRYVIISASAAVHGFLFVPDFTGLPLIWDTQTGVKYRLPDTTGPVCGFKSGDIYWIQ